MERTNEVIKRRTFVISLAGIAASLACRESPMAPVVMEPARLRVIPAKPTRSAKLGLQPIGLLPALPALQRDGVLYVPQMYKPSEPLPLVVLLHGSSGSGESWFGSYGARADAARVIMLAPDSRSFSWDATQEEPFGVDIAFLNEAIASAFDRCAIDSSRMAIVGFSDGASYALSLGLANGDVFRSVVAYSPGGIYTNARHGHPAIRMFHGTNDTVLPIDQTSRRMVPELRQAGYDVTYTEFDGGHEVSASVADASMAWLGSEFAAW
ncbi:MAG: alpha/beta hydrolase-fold protein [Gemmatimonadaceae bacterium]